MARRLLNLGIIGCVVTALAGCASYERAPLDARPELAARVTDLAGPYSAPITLAKLDALVLRNNPDLKTARLRIGVATAQIIQAGILPNPQFSASYPFYISGPNGGDGFGLSLAQDLRSILLRPIKREAATYAAAGVNASVLWQEWQTLGKARLLFVDIVSGERARKVFQRNRTFLKERFDLTNAAIKQGSATLATLSPDLVALGDVEKAAADLDRTQLTRRHQLNALLGLKPDAVLPLAAATPVPTVDPRRVRLDLASLADRRPDLIALQYGYRSTDAQLRQAIVAQFPNIIVGALGGRDSSFVNSAGPQVSFDIPIFDRNEGNIAIERATRAQLEQEFKARITAAAGEIGALLSEQDLLKRQLASLAPRLKEAQTIARQTEEAHKQGSFDERAYVDIEVAELAREQEQITLQQTLLEGQVLLATLAGAGMPRVTIPPEPPPADPLGIIKAVSR